jgi:hypothetical protein
MICWNFSINKGAAMTEKEGVPYWRRCTTCKKSIGFGHKYWICSVSTCNRVRTGLVFCDLKCFDAHVPVLNHRDAGAFERKAPSEREFEAQKAKEASSVKLEKEPAHSPAATGAEHEILVVVSKVKDYIRSQSGMNTSHSVMDLLSDFVRAQADFGISSAEQNGRKTVLDRDLG